MKCIYIYIYITKTSYGLYLYITLHDYHMDAWNIYIYIYIYIFKISYGLYLYITLHDYHMDAWNVYIYIYILLKHHMDYIYILHYLTIIWMREIYIYIYLYIYLFIYIFKISYGLYLYITLHDYHMDAWNVYIYIWMIHYHFVQCDTRWYTHIGVSLGLAMVFQIAGFFSNGERYKPSNYPWVNLRQLRKTTFTLW